MTLVLGLPAILWGIRVLPGKKNGKEGSSPKKNNAGKTHELNRLSLLYALTARLVFHLAAA